MSRQYNTEAIEAGVVLAPCHAPMYMYVHAILPKPYVGYTPSHASALNRATHPLQRCVDISH